MQGDWSKETDPDLGPTDALLLVHLQLDFLPGGALPVKGGDLVVPVLNRWIARCKVAGARVIATRDWHPPDHCSFQAQGGPWPVHCVAGTEGATFTPALALPPEAPVFSQATSSQTEAYSGFEGTGLADDLRRADIGRLLVGGLATEYCVFHTVLAALQLGFQVVVLADGVRPVEVHPGDGERAMEAMVEAGAVLLRG